MSVRAFPLCVFLSLLVCTVARAADEPPDYGKQIAPIFNKYCNACHNPDDHEGKLSLATFDELQKGGKRGQAISAGHSDQSLLIRVLTGQAKPAMPPEDNERPKPEEIELLKQWIDAGAKGPQGAAPDPTILVTPRIEPRGAVRRAITAVAFSPKGDVVAVGRHGVVELIAADTREVRHTLREHTGNVNDLAFTADGTQLIAAAGQPGLFGEVRLWNIADGQLIRSWRGHADSIYSLATTNGGKLLATGSYDQKIKLWDVESGSERRTLEGHNGGIFGLAFRNDGKLLASASGDRTIKLWNVESGERLDTFSQPIGDQYAVAFSPDGRFVAAAGGDNRIRLWRLSDTAAEGTNELLYARFAHEQPIVALAWSPDGKTVATSGEDRRVKLWHAGDVTERIVLEPQPDVADSLAFSADSKRLAAGRLDGSLAVYNADDGKALDAAPPPKPELASVSPAGVRPSQTIRLTVKGKHLSGINKVSFNDPRLTGHIVEGGAASDHASVDVAVASDLPRGEYEVSVENAGGASNKLKLFADNVTHLAEVEPNNALDASQVMEMPASIWGSLISAGDVDTFRVAGKAGQTLVAELSSKTIGSKANGVLELFDPHGKLVAANNDFDAGSDPLVAFTLPADGQYTLRVSELMLMGGLEYQYRLTVGELPFVVGVYPVSVAAKQESHVELIGYNLPSDRKVVIKAGDGGEASVPIDANKFRSRRGLSVIVSGLPESLEAEPNNTLGSPTTVAVPGSLNGRIGTGGDEDVYRFEARKGQQWLIETNAARRGSPVDTRIEVLSADGKPIERVSLQAVRDSYINFRSITSTQTGIRLKNWEEMELNEYVYLSGEVSKLFRAPQGPDSDSLFYEATPGIRRTYFDTSGTAHANYDTAYIVEPHTPGAKLPNNGLPVFPVYFANDDASDRDIGADSRVLFTVPSDGAYLVRVTDAASAGGDRYVYRLTIREPAPDFNVRLGGTDPNVPKAGGQTITFDRVRVDGFDGPIRVDVTGGLPPGYQVTSPITIEAGHRAALGTVFAAAEAIAPVNETEVPAKITATAEINGQQVTKEIGSLGKLALRDKPKVVVQLIPEAQPAGKAPANPQLSSIDGAPTTPQITMAPGTMITARIKIERNGHTGSVQLEVLNLPHGVIVDNLGLNGLLIMPEEDERQIFLTASKWVADTDRLIFAKSNVGENATSAPVMFHIRRREGEVARK